MYLLGYLTISNDIVTAVICLPDVYSDLIVFHYDIHNDKVNLQNSDNSGNHCIDGSVWGCSDSIANALELLQLCTNPSISSS